MLDISVVLNHAVLFDDNLDASDVAVRSRNQQRRVCAPQSRGQRIHLKFKQVRESV
jgi:hypothetical protein